MQYSVTVNNARLDAIESSTGTAPTLTLYSGTAPSNCAAADTGTALVAITLPSDWMNAASAASKTLLGTWSGTASAGSSTAPTHFRIKQGATCHIQGTAGVASGECQVNGSITNGQTVTVSTFTINAGNT